MAIGRRRAIDYFRRQQRFGRKLDEIDRSIETQTPELTDDVIAALDREIQDDLLRLIFTACHPILPAEARVALTLRVVGGLTTDEIARAYLVSEATVAQRIVRAKRALATAHVPFAVLELPERSQRLASVLEVIYLIFNEGYSATSGSDWLRPELCDEALGLGRTLAESAPCSSA
jgi:predicted RNA polymerase sigma factor